MGQHGVKMISKAAGKFVSKDDEVMCSKAWSPHSRAYIVCFLEIPNNSAILYYLNLCLPGPTPSYNFRHFKNSMYRIA